MSEVYNPESQLLERLENLEIEARRLARKRDVSTNNKHREILTRQLQETEAQINHLRWLRHQTHSNL